ncbi:auxin-induced in root cultures protein 12 [Prosopis cineraria]|uniref:auxin-induced in root cultures protein 12 n=1 Tax=Prosopis cineraria TaxID=364024 RepID=UPI00240F1CDD|nr:auxin-induced in root cultures protein 12 [Prosopis cineraria]
MAPCSSSFSSLIFAVSAIFFALSFSSVHSLTCKSQKLPDKKAFSNCTDLSSLGATLHYSYNATNNSLSIAYVATPAKSGGWVSWAINPTGLGMLGAQAIIAFKSNDTVVAKTYNLTSYKAITESKLSFDVWDLSAVESDGAITILASVKVPGKPDKLNQVWQVGSSVTDGRPDKHEFAPANLNAKSTLSVSTSTTAAENTTTGSEKNDGVSATNNRFGLGFYAGLLILLASCVDF